MVWSAPALLNLTLAYLVMSVRPTRLVNGVAAAMFGLNGLVAIVHVAVAAGLSWVDPFAWPGDFSGGGTIYALNTLTLMPLVLLPFVFPWRRLRPRAERGLFLALSIIVIALLVWVLLLTFFCETCRLADPPAWVTAVRRAAELLFVLLFYGGPALGAVLFLDAYLGARGRIQREQVRFFLAAYALKCATLPAAVRYAEEPSPLAALGALMDGNPTLALLGVLPLLAALAIPIAIAAARARRPSPARPLPGDLFVLAFVAAGALFPVVGTPAEVEYMLLRPLLIGYGILRFQLLELDLRERWRPIVAALLAAIGVLFMTTWRLLENAGVDVGVTAGVALVTSLAAVLILARPFVHVRAAGGAPDAAGGRELYIAALVEAHAAGEAHGASSRRVLGTLRARLGISEREHAVLEALAQGGATEPAASSTTGARLLGRYLIERPLGEGAFGRTLLAWDEQVERRVVLKVRRAADPQDAKRMLREARLLARVGHANIVGVHDVELVGDECILVLEHIEGGSLADRLARGRLPPGKAARVAGDVLAALEAAHAEGIIHRDIKPANILLGRDGTGKLADFGVARVVDESGTAAGLSLDGRAPGTLRYMAPEQVRGEPADARSDLYAVGAVLYEMLAGRPYLDFGRKAEFEVRLAVLEQEPRLPLRGVPRHVSQLLASLLAKDAAARPRSAAAARRRLDAADKSRKL